MLDLPANVRFVLLETNRIKLNLQKGFRFVSVDAVFWVQPRQYRRVVEPNDTVPWQMETGTEL